MLNFIHFPMVIVSLPPPPYNFEKHTEKAKPIQIHSVDDCYFHFIVCVSISLPLSLLPPSLLLTKLVLGCQ